MQRYCYVKAFEITAANTKPSQFAFTSRFLVTNVNSGDYTSLTVTAAHMKSLCTA
jgi:hypothetical protein